MFSPGGEGQSSPSAVVLGPESNICSCPRSRGFLVSSFVQVQWVFISALRGIVFVAELPFLPYRLRIVPVCQQEEKRVQAAP